MNTPTPQPLTDPFHIHIPIPIPQRGGNDEAPWISLKAEFMTLWDGVLTDSTVPIMVLGATNRPYDLDPVRSSPDGSMPRHVCLYVRFVIVNKP